MSGLQAKLKLLLPGKQNNNVKVCLKKTHDARCYVLVGFDFNVIVSELYQLQWYFVRSFVHVYHP